MKTLWQNATIFYFSKKLKCAKGLFATVFQNKNKVTGHLGMLGKMYGLLCMLKTPGKQSKNENVVSSFLAVGGKMQKAFLVQWDAGNEEAKKQKQMKVNRKSKLKE